MQRILTILDSHIDHGTCMYMSAGHVSPYLDLISLPTYFVKFTSSFRDLVSFSIIMLIIFGPNIDHKGYMSAGHMSPYLNLIFMVN